MILTYFNIFEKHVDLHKIYKIPYFYTFMIVVKIDDTVKMLLYYNPYKICMNCSK